MADYDYSTDLKCAECGKNFDTIENLEAHEAWLDSADAND